MKLTNTITKVRTRGPDATYDHVRRVGVAPAQSHVAVLVGDDGYSIGITDTAHRQDCEAALFKGRKVAAVLVPRYQDGKPENDKDGFPIFNVEAATTPAVSKPKAGGKPPGDSVARVDTV